MLIDSSLSEKKAASGLTVHQRIYHRLLELFPNGCQRFLLITPPESLEQDFNMDLVLSKRYPCFPPYGPGVLARNLEERGYHGTLLDLNFYILKQAHENPKGFSFKAWKTLLDRKIEEFKPDIIGVSVMFTMTLPSLSEVCKHLKTTHPSLPIIAGGICISNDVERTLRIIPEIDLGSFYEGDKSFPNLLDVINQKQPAENLKQIAILDGDELVSTKERATPTEEEMDASPEYYNLPIGDYSRYGAVGAYNFMRGDRKASTVIGNRGCRARCSFCAVRNFNGLSVRDRGVLNVVDEMQHHYESYGITHFMWLDDDLLYNSQRAIELFNEIVSRNLKITWDATNGIIAAAITPEIMKAASASGCIGFNLGLESGSDEILRAIRKPGTTDSYRRTKEIMEDYPHIFVKGFMIIGFPNETMAQIRQSVSLAQELQFGWYPLQLLTPLPGTDISLSMIEQGLIKPPTDATFWGSAAKSKSGAGGSLRQRETDERHNARQFVDLLSTLPDDHIPTSGESNDLWFSVDYKMNYEKILQTKNPVKLRNVEKMLRQITDEYTKDNALGNLYLSVIASKLNNPAERDNRLVLAERYQKESDYWTKRFVTFDMFSIMNKLRAGHVAA